MARKIVRLNGKKCTFKWQDKSTFKWQDKSVRLNGKKVYV